MELNINFQTAPKGYFDGLLRTGHYVHNCGLDAKLVELIKVRVSQINGCAYCLDMHYKDAVHTGETEQRLYSLPAWRDCPYYSDAERAALAFAEAVNAKEHLTREVTDPMEEHFTSAEIANITLAVINISAWNKLNKVLQPLPGTYKVGMFAPATETA